MPHHKQITKPVITVYEDLREKIIKGELSPSESLTESELSVFYKVSRNTVKKALLMLERESLVIIELNKGAKVRSYSLREVLEYLEVRGVLEGTIVSLAVPVISEQSLDKLDNILKEMKINKELHNLMDYSKGNHTFHQVIYDACPNRTLVELSKSLRTQMSKYNTKTILIPGRDNQSFEEHAAIFDAIKARQPLTAETLMRTHIKNVRDCFEQNYLLLF